MKEEKERKKKVKKFKLIFAEKLEVFGLVGFIFSLFLLDVNANMIGSFGQEVQVNLLFGKTLASVDLFWVGFFLLTLCFLLLGARTMYHPKRNRVKMDLTFSALGVVGLMIILSGGMMLFWLGNNTIIPFFGYPLTRISYYHIGIIIGVVTSFYFAWFK